MTQQPNDSASAVALAVRFTGFARLGSVATSARRAPAPASQTAFLSTSMGRMRDVWEVELRDVALALPSAAGVSDPLRRTFTVRIGDGKLLEIRSRWDGTDPLLLPRPPAAHAEAQLLAAGERYTGLPDAPPGVDFLTALDRVASEGFGSPLAAKEIDGLYVMHARGEQLVLPAWVIELRGLPPMPVRGPAGAGAQADVPAWLRNHMRNVLDARTGRVLFANNAPQPEPPSGPLVA